MFADEVADIGRVLARQAVSAPIYGAVNEMFDRVAQRSIDECFSLTFFGIIALFCTGKLLHLLEIPLITNFLEHTYLDAENSPYGDGGFLFRCPEDLIWMI